MNRLLNRDIHIDSIKGVAEDFTPVYRQNTKYTNTLSISAKMTLLMSISSIFTLEI
jgi:hypothetical protein